jgi:hypothetical protein
MKGGEALKLDPKVLDVEGGVRRASEEEEKGSKLNKGAPTYTHISASFLTSGL